MQKLVFGTQIFYQPKLKKGKKNSERWINFAKKLDGIYLRIATKKKTFILSTFEGFKIKTGKRKFKFLFGVEGED